MPEKTSAPSKKTTADWLLRGVLTKLGDTFDRFTGRRWVPSSSLATSELIERLKKLLDAEAREIPGKGFVVPHNISLKMQWDKFSDDSEKGIAALRDELTIAAVDHINNSLYYTLAPVRLEVKTDYFTEGVKLMVGFDSFDEDEKGVELNVSLPSLHTDAGDESAVVASERGIGAVIARYSIGGRTFEKRIAVNDDGRISIGRTGPNSLLLDDVSISKMHASLLVGDDGTLSVADTGSTNGTFLNGERIGYGKVVQVAEGDRIKFGTIEVSFELVKQGQHADDGNLDPKRTDTVEIGGFEFSSRTGEPEVTELLDLPRPDLEKTVNIMPTRVESLTALAQPLAETEEESKEAKEE